MKKYVPSLDTRPPLINRRRGCSAGACPRAAPSKCSGSATLIVEYILSKVNIVCKTMNYKGNFKRVLYQILYSLRYENVNSSQEYHDYPAMARVPAANPLQCFRQGASFMKCTVS